MTMKGHAMSGNANSHFNKHVLHTALHNQLKVSVCLSLSLSAPEAPAAPAEAAGLTVSIVLYGCVQCRRCVWLSRWLVAPMYDYNSPFSRVNRDRERDFPAKSNRVLFNTLYTVSTPWPRGLLRGQHCIIIIWPFTGYTQKINSFS